MFFIEFIMPDRFRLQVIIFCFLAGACLLAHANSDLASIKNDMDKTQQSIQTLSTNIEQNEKQTKEIQLIIKRYQLELKSITSKKSLSEADNQALNKTQFEIKRAQFNLNKNQAERQSLQTALDAARNKKRALALQLEESNSPTKKTTAIVPVPKATTIAATPNKPAVKPPQKPVNAVVKPTAPIVAKPIQAPVKPATVKEQPKVIVSPASAKPSTTAAPLISQAIVEKPVIAAPIIAANNETPTTTQTAKPVSENSISSVKSSSKTQTQYIESSNSLPPPESALTIAMARSLDAKQESALLGEEAILSIANPVGSRANAIGNLRHLGNNQYLLEARISKGRQELIVGQYHFIKIIPEHYDKVLCLFLLDARNSKKPDLQLIISGN